MRAAELIEGARTIFLGVGTTVEQFARYFHASELTVVTASPTASLLGTRAVRTIALGGHPPGRLRRPVRSRSRRSSASGSTSR
jgi:DeoR/GlpR family transcriptional regulator of sugar metabolism